MQLERFIELILIDVDDFFGVVSLIKDNDNHDEVLAALRKLRSMDISVQSLLVVHQHILRSFSL